MFEWFKKLKNIVSTYDKDYKRLSEDYKYLYNRITEAEKLIKDRTTISADVVYSGPDRNQIIVTGRYRSRDYVQVFTLADNELKTLVDQLREMERYGVIDKVDAIHGMKEVIKRSI